MARSGDFIIEDDNTNNTRTMTPLYSSIYGHGSDALDTDFENTFKEAGKECDGSVGGKITNYSGRYDIGSDAVTTVYRRTGAETEKKSVSFRGLEAAIIEHFFMQTRFVKVLADVTLDIKQPKDGGVIITYSPNLADTVEELLDVLEQKMNALDREELHYDNSGEQKVDEFVKQALDPTLLIYLDKTQRIVHFIGDKDRATEYQHKLKAHLGIIKETSDRRFRRHTRQGPEGTSVQKYPVDATGESYTSSGQENDDFHFERTLQNGLVLKVYKASITKLDVDTIVNAANGTLMHGEGVARVIAMAAGYELDRDSREYIQKNGHLEVGKTCITSPGKLPYRSVIHAVGPQWRDYRDKEECCDVLYGTIMNILRQCGEQGYFSVGMPAISDGIFGVPKELCADMYIKAVVDYCETKEVYPKELHIVDIDVRILKHVEVAFREWERDPSYIVQQIAVPIYLISHPEVDGGEWNSRGK